MDKLLIRELFESGAKTYLLGIGTTWMGRPWPPDNASYRLPDQQEINTYLNQAFAEIKPQSFKVMIDTASSYGNAEEKLGRYFKPRKEHLSQSLIATKWGEEFKLKSSVCRLDHSLKQLEKSLQASLNHLPKIDILYIHRTNNSVLTDKAVIDRLQTEKDKKTIGYIGASFSNEQTLAEAVSEKLISWCDLIQMPAQVFLKRPDLSEKIRKNHSAIVVNSPVRKGAAKPPKQIYQELITKEKIGVILTGTRHHLKETLNYFLSSNRNK